MNKDKNNIKDISNRLMEVVQVENLNPTIFALQLDNGKTIIFKGQETKTIVIQDIISIASGTRAFSGKDGIGTSAPLYILDRPLRIHLGYESGSGDNQEILDEKRVSEILDLDLKEFKKIIIKMFDSIPKKALLEKVIISKSNVDARKIKFVEKELGLEINYK